MFTKAARWAYTSATSATPLPWTNKPSPSSASGSNTPALTSSWMPRPRAAVATPLQSTWLSMATHDGGPVYDLSWGTPMRGLIRAHQHEGRPPSGMELRWRRTWLFVHCGRRLPRRATRSRPQRGTVCMQRPRRMPPLAIASQLALKPGTASSAAAARQGAS